MSVKQSSYILLAKLKARYELEKHKSEVGMIIRFQYAKHERKIKKLWEIYDYNPEKHKSLYSPHSIVRNSGCGCKLCVAQHEYAFEKLHLHYLKKSFYSDDGMDNLMMFRERNFPVRDNFYALYSEHTVKEKEPLSQRDFFEKIYSKRKQEVKELRSKYRAIQESIQHMLAD